MPVVEREIRLPAAAATPATLVVVLLERRPGRVRGWIAKTLIRIAGRLAGMRVRIELTR